MYFKSFVIGVILCALLLVSVVNASNYEDAKLKYRKSIVALTKNKNNSLRDFEQILRQLGELKVELKRVKQDRLNLAELTSLALGRVYYEMAFGLEESDLKRVKLLKQALVEYQLIPRFSSNWPNALFEQAWVYTLLADHGGALGALHSLKHPYFAGSFFPEAYYLEALNYWYNCQWDTAALALQQFDLIYGSKLIQFQNALKVNSKPQDLPKFIQQVLSKDPLWNKFVISFAQISNEAENVNIVPEIRIAYKQAETKLLNNFSKFTNSSLQRMVDEINEVKQRNKLLALEINSGEILTYNQAENVNSPISRRYFSADSGQFFWWANSKEKWEDELGFYRFALVSKCHVKK